MKKALVLGGTNDHIYLIEKLKKNGFSTVLIDYLENPPAKNFADKFIRKNAFDKNAVLETAREVRPDIVISVAIDQTLPVIAYVSETLKLPCHITYAQALEITNKALMKKKFVENNIPTTSFIIIKEKFDEKIVQKIKFPCVVKPTDANSSKGVTKVNEKKELQSALEEAFKISRTKIVIAEEFINGTEISTDVVISDGNAYVIMISEIIKSKTNKRNFTITGNIFSFEFHNKYEEQIKKIAEKIAKTFNLKNALLLIQLIDNNGKLFVVEFSSRIGGGSKYHLIKKVTGFDIIDYFLALTLKEKMGPPQIEIAQNFAAMLYVYAKPGNFASYEIPENLTQNNVIENLFLYKMPGAVISQSVSSSDRILGILLTARTENELVRKSEKIIAEIKIFDENKNDMTKRDFYRETADE